ncbi:acyltransferase family protein [Thalassotalea fonticola]|uniref:Acyltransferase family protein n=1 Tax=Thalassotalea fonticola TaxID=3065649 RepID=A0ABZ0GUC9_9GAMM|nr:acyltransferase family protein [Colwelliaceae bacterium S1-1]
MKFRNDINGLRAIAVMVVVLFHFKVIGFNGGFIGVDIFFVISGYLMTQIIFSKLSNNNFTLLNFYIDRGARIIPALAVLCLVLIALGWFYLIPSDYEKLGKHIIGAISFISNILFWREAGYFDASSHEKWLLHTWSLSVEWQFYIIYPILISILWGRLSKSSVVKVIVIAFLLSLFTSIFLTRTSPSTAFFLLPSRAWEMLLGAMVFLFPLSLKSNQQRLLNLCGIILICLSVFYFSSTDLWPSYLAILPCLGTALVISSNYGSFFTNNKISEWLGNASYSIYLWHWPIVVGLNQFQLTDDWYWVFFGVVTSIALGGMSYAYIEKPIKTHYKTKKMKPKIHTIITKPSFYFLIVVSIGTVGGYIKFSDGFYFRVNEAVTLANMEKFNTNKSFSKCLIQDSYESSGCLYGSEGKVKLIVLGDSHGLSLISALELGFVQNKIDGKILFLGFAGCPVIENVKFRSFPSSKCGEWSSNQLKKIERDYENIPVVFITRASLALNNQTDSLKITSPGPLVYFSTPKSVVDEQLLIEFKDGYKNTINRLSKNRKVFIVKPIPEYYQDIPLIMARRAMFSDFREISLSEGKYKQRNAIILDLLSLIEVDRNVTLLDPLPLLCKNSTCYSSLSGRPLYSDSDHLSEWGNKFIIPMFSPLFEEILSY